MDGYYSQYIVGHIYLLHVLDNQLGIDCSLRICDEVPLTEMLGGCAVFVILGINI